MARLVFCTVTMLLSFDLANAGTWTTLDFPGARSTMIYGVSGSNFAGNYVDSSGVSHGFLYNGNTWTAFDMPSGSAFMRVTGIDGSNIVGWYGDHGFIYDCKTWTTFVLPGKTYTSINGIDGSNIIGLADKQGFVYNLSTQVKTILDVPGTAHGIDGTNIVGYYMETVPMEPFSSITHGFIYDGTNWTTLDMPGSTQTRIFDIDGSNIVGLGFLYNMTTNEWTTLNVPGAGTARAQSIDGDNIVGYYYDTDHSVHGFLYTIPEPCSFLLLATGFTFISSVKCRLNNGNENLTRYYKDEARK